MVVLLIQLTLRLRILTEALHNHGKHNSNTQRYSDTNWTSANPTLAQGELGLETDTLKLKAGDGSTAWNSASYLIDTGGYITASYSGDVAITGSLAGDNIKLDGNAISSTNTNGNIQLFPNGTGYTELYGNTNAGTIVLTAKTTVTV